ncbi:hypothetical protein EYF80_020285 [Liparis tanakae]|uniref:Uncharacterized protein n=1 Tax=Liparis tanakae TaxID=230148 RepID=A0A4Z2HV44_9TELE|nr:hypothetical protein EYF80_020285 [Liparis tanakae]
MASGRRTRTPFSWSQLTSRNSLQSQSKGLPLRSLGERRGKRASDSIETSKAATALQPRGRPKPVKRLLWLSPGASTVVARGMSAAAGALSSPMLEQLTTQDWGCGPAGAQLQLTGQGLQLPPPSPGGPEPHASRQQSATSTPDKKLNLGTQTPCFRLDNKVCPFPQGIAQSHLIASDGVSPLESGKEHSARDKGKHARAPFLPTAFM